MNPLWSWRRRGREDRAVAEEVRAHIEERVDELMEQGMGEPEAHRRARQEFGNATAVREEIHQANSLWLLDTCWQDLRLAVRSLTKHSGFALGVVLTLGLGVGATTAAFTAVNGVVLSELPYNDPSTLVAVGWIDPGAEWVEGATNLQNLTPMWDPTFLELRERARSFDDFAGLLLQESHAGPSGDGLPPEAIRVAGVTPGLLEMLDARPALGRTFLSDEYEARAEVAMISHGTWQRRFGADPDVLGRSLHVTEGKLTVVGVLPPDFHPPEAFIPIEEAPELWVPIRVDQAAGEIRRVRNLMVLGRMAPGRSLDQARAEVDRIAADLAVEFPGGNVQRGVARRIGVNDLHAQTIGSTGKLQLFLGAAVLLLILAAMNAATLLLGRALDAVRPNISGYVITPGYLDLVGSEIVAGRDFRSQDRPGSERVALVNETFARTILGGTNAVDRTILWSAGTEWAEGDEWIPPAEWRTGKPAPLRIVGVVEDVVQLRLGEGSRPAIYVPYTQSRTIGPRAVIRFTLPLQAVVPGLRAAVARFNPRVPGPLEIAPMAIRERAVLRFQVMLIGAFSITAVLLATAGLYGSMLHLVGLRQREFGVRMALGESRAGIFTWVLRQGALVSMSGLG